MFELHNLSCEYIFLEKKMIGQITLSNLLSLKVTCELGNRLETKRQENHDRAYSVLVKIP
jgi:hypothetical protein